MMRATLRDGAELAYDVFDFSDPWTEAEPLILVHGFSKNRLFWFDWIPALSRRYRVICVDQRGHGDSSVPSRDFDMALRPFADDMAAFLDALGLRSAHFVMAEFTSAVAIEFAIAYPERIRSLTLPGLLTNSRESTIDHSEWARLAEEEGAPAWARATNHNRLPTDADPALRDWYIAQQGRMPGWFLGKLFRFNANMDLTDRLSLIPVPTLLLVGTNAKQSTMASAERAAELIPHNRLVPLAGMPFNVMSSAPEACAAATLGFIDDVKRGLI